VVMLALGLLAVKAYNQPETSSLCYVSFIVSTESALVVFYV
jgi:hypothetical protein